MVYCIEQSRPPRYARHCDFFLQELINDFSSDIHNNPVLLTLHVPAALYPRLIPAEMPTQRVLINHECNMLALRKDHYHGHHNSDHGLSRASLPLPPVVRMRCGAVRCSQISAFLPYHMHDPSQVLSRYAHAHAQARSTKY